MAAAENSRSRDVCPLKRNLPNAGDQLAASLDKSRSIALAAPVYVLRLVLNRRHNYE
ncbi:hypothetical protein PATA110616_08560 [Paenibacillus tarimensis]